MQDSLLLRTVPACPGLGGAGHWDLRGVERKVFRKAWAFQGLPHHFLLSWPDRCDAIHVEDPRDVL